MSFASDQRATVLETRAVGKSFGVIRALQGVSFSLKAGEVHGLVGENGAGKSTLIKILTGFYQPDAGEILLDGRPVSFGDPRAAQRLGVTAVYQEINLVPERSVAENIFLGREPKRAKVLIDRARMERDAAAILQRYDLHIAPGGRLGALGLGLQQMVSIARVVSLGAKVVILDEPTSALSGAEVGILYDVVRRLRADGIAILFVSHRLSECYALCDRLTVLRDGQSVRSGTPQELPKPELIAAMLGQQRGQTTEAREKHRRAIGDAAPVMRVRSLRWRERVRGVSLEVRPREILGLAGLLGSGRTETFKAIFGAQRPDGGQVEVAGQAVRQPAPADSIARGIAFLPEDRRSEGIFPKLSVRENMTAAVLPRISRFGIVSRRKQEQMVRHYIQELGIKTAGPQQAISGLSGGNQQKVLLARCLCARPKVIMLDDPTRGIDVGAKAEVHRVVRGLADEGLGVLVTSSEVEELLDLSDRLVVLTEGAVSGQMDADAASPDAVLDLLAAHPA